MRWTVALFFAWITLGLDAGLRSALSIGDARIAPYFSLPLVVFIALSAPTLASLWSAFLIGVVVDLTSQRAGVAGYEIVFVGPHALGYMAAAYLVLTLRGVMMRKSLVALVVMSVLGAMAETVVSTALMTVKSLYSASFELSPTTTLLQGAGSAVYTAFSAALLGLILIPGHSWFRFNDPLARRYGGR
ncbi:MAG: rod shape-determining protein MreD [Phycisphaeraceae bacterium]|nr:rod shape-determining protein MreD [Phycisphaeraceae bacterium]